jgi:glycosyltransferase involved in cell wall biosynthesis
MITYNHEDYIEEAIHGVLKQKTSFELELVISNDNSPDATHEIIQRIRQEHPKGDCIKYIRHTENIGIMPNSMHNLRHCTGDYIAFCEGDDSWTDGLKLQIQINEMQQHPQCDISFHPAIIFSGHSNTDCILGFQSTKTRIYSASDIIMGGGDFCPTASLLLRRSVLETLPQFLNNAPVGDYFLQVLGSIRGGALYLNRVMCKYRRNTPFSWSSEMKSIKSKTVFFHKLSGLLLKFDSFLQGVYRNELRFEIERQYRYLSLIYLTNRLYKDYTALFEEYCRHHPCSLRLRLLNHFGDYTKSATLTSLLDRILFGHPNFIQRAYQNTLRTFHLKRHKPSPFGSEDSQPETPLKTQIQLWTTTVNAKPGEPAPLSKTPVPQNSIPNTN